MPGRAIIPRDAVIDRMCGYINGTTAPDKGRFGYLSRKRAKHTLDMFKMAYGNPMSEGDMSNELRKSVTVATGLTYYDLRAPALNLFPTVTPLRNSIPRMQRQFPGDAAHWKVVTSTVGSGMPFMGWVPEGKRSASMSYNTSTVTLNYVTIGEEDSLTEEARFAAEGFEDETPSCNSGCCCAPSSRKKPRCSAATAPSPSPLPAASPCRRPARPAPSPPAAPTLPSWSR